MDWTVNVNWTLVCSVVGIVLNSLALYFWQPWAGAYAGEKGKNFARKEDSDAILAEVRAITAVQKGIESTLAGDLWARQMVWTHKKDTYAKLIFAAQEATHQYRNVASMIKAKASSQNEKDRTHFDDEVTKAMQAGYDAKAELYNTMSLAKLFCNEQCIQELDSYSDSERHSIEDLLPWAVAMAIRTDKLLTTLILVARSDLSKYS